MRLSKTLLIPITALLLLATAIQAQQARSRTYEAVISGMTCKQQKTVDTGSLECDYHVGKSLHFTIAGVGDPDSGVTFMSSSFDGDYYASVGILHGCIIVKPGRAQGDSLDVVLDFAFVSPRNGKVYHDWPSCAAAKS